MSEQTYLRIATGLSAAGTAFAGYLSLTRMTSGVCAFDEPCPFFLGHPACYTGFVLFGVALAISTGALLSRATSAWPMIVNTLIGAAGTLFAARMTGRELSAFAGYKLGLPTCAYGFVFFVALLVVSLVAWMRRARPRRLAPG